MPLDNPPKSIRIGPFDFQIIYRKPGLQIDPDKGLNSDADHYGQTSMRETKIYVTIFSEGQMRCTLLHEMIHVMFENMHEKAEEKMGEETICTLLAPILLDTLVRNPEVTAYLLGRSK